MLIEQRADILFTGGRIWTGVEQRGPLDTVAVHNGRVVGLGTEADLRWAVGPRTRVIALQGRLLVPAFGDAHVHPLLAGLSMSRCWLSDTPEDPAEYLKAISVYAAAEARPPWIIGEGWTLDAFRGGLPTAHALDAVVPERPVYLESRDGHSAWVNSVALSVAGIGPDTPDPRFGRIERHPDGSPQGTLHERATELVARHLPLAGAAELEEALRRGQTALQRLGIGSWQDADVDAGRQAAYVALAGRGELTGRAALALQWDPDRGAEQVAELVARRQLVADEGAGRVHAPTVKVFQDGVVENGTAAMLAPYVVPEWAAPTGRGESVYDPIRLRDLCVALDDARFAVHAHAIGDRAVREVLDALTAARRINGPRDGRHQIAHLQFVDPADLPRFRPLGVIASVQPYWAHVGDSADDLTRSMVGADRVERMYPFGSLARSGATLALGSDWAVTTADPMRILEVATRRIDPDRREQAPLGPSSERLSIESALRAYTRGSAHANGLEELTGTIEDGRPADLVVLDRDPMSAPGIPFGDALVLMTLVDGRPVWEHPDLGA